MQADNVINKLKTRWKVNSVWQVLLILGVFACTGFSVMYLKKPLFDLFNLSAESPWYFKTLFYIFIFLPMYQVVLLFFGLISGQFIFFWNFVKRMCMGLSKLFLMPFVFFRKKKKIVEN